MAAAMDGKWVILQVGLILLLGELISAGKDTPKVRLVDQIDNKPINQIADILCGPHDGNYQLFVSFKTPQKLIDYLTETSDEEAVRCWTQYGESISLLNYLIQASSNDVCSDEKITLIEEFHHKYISKTRKDVKEQEANRVPHLVTIFFIHYVDRVGKICKKNLNYNLEDLTAEDRDIKAMNDDTRPNDIDSLLAAFDKSFEFELVTHHQKYMSLFWDLVDEVLSEPGSDNSEVSKYVSSADELGASRGSGHRVTVKIGATPTLLSFQDYCRYRLRPIYSRTVLPVLRLIGLGYYVEQIFTIPSRWYKVTQLCETVLPIRMITDESLAEGQVVIIPKDEAAEIIKKSDTQASANTLYETPELREKRNRFNGDSLWWLVSDEMMKTDNLLSTIDDRKDVVKRYMIKMAPKIQEMSQNKRGVLLLASREGNEDLTEAIGQGLTGVNGPTAGEKRKDKARQLVKGVWSGITKANNKFKRMLAKAFLFLGGLLLICSIPLAGLLALLMKADDARVFVARFNQRLLHDLTLGEHRMKKIV